MSGHFTDRDERMWQLRAEERAARPPRVAALLRALRATVGRAPAPTPFPGAARVPRRNARTPVPGRRGPVGHGGTGGREGLDQATG
ncbi:hypothetical protein [Streptomyces sp. NPDC002057]|uniref:hypothetical protein n=1 Tax=Streptomyces sp. NPDC002057 TaxID=3154664 RepID=UPI003317C361